MALRVRRDGRILCAAMHPERPGDVYVDDAVHYLLSVEWGVIETDEHERHRLHGEWWLVGEDPDE